MSNQYRDRTTGTIKTRAQLIAENSTMVFPKNWGQKVYDHLNVDPVLRSTPPTTANTLQVVVMDGATKSNGEWYQNWVVRDRFTSDVDVYDPEANTTTTLTVSQQITNYTEKRNEGLAATARRKRDQLLADSDWVAIKAAESGASVDSAWATYRTALRDITDHANFPDLANDDWPTKPE